MRSSKNNNARGTIVVVRRHSTTCMNNLSYSRATLLTDTIMQIDLNQVLTNSESEFEGSPSRDQALAICSYLMFPPMICMTTSVADLPTVSICFSAVMPCFNASVISLFLNA